MPEAHRHDDLRSPCNGKTIVKRQSTVYVNNKLWSVRGDPDDHTNDPDGALIDTAGHTVFIENKPVIVKGDNAHPDKDNPNPRAKNGSPDVYAY